MSDGSYDPVTHTHPCVRCGQTYECAAGFEQDGSRGWCRAYDIASECDCPECAVIERCHWCGDADVWADDLCFECSHDGETTVVIEDGLVVVRAHKDGETRTLTLTRWNAAELLPQLNAVLASMPQAASTPTETSASLPRSTPPSGDC